LFSIEEARKARFRPASGFSEIAVPSFQGRRLLRDIDIAQVRKYIDWTFFFSAWELKGKFPAILQHAKYGQAARDLFEQGQKLLDQIQRDKSLAIHAVYGFWPVNAVSDDIVVWEPNAAKREKTRFHMLRQQARKDPGQPEYSLVDFVADQESGITDYIGAFAVSAGFGVDTLVKRFEADHDDYNAIMVKSLADRLAEASAEWLHEKARHDWGYGASEKLSNDDLIAERYRGIRPAFGYPACPDHLEKNTLWELIGANEIGMTLTEHCAMVPAASVSGLYFAHPESKYFAVGRIGRDQVQDYARRKGRPLAEMERWLQSNLAYEPAGS
jgi:5-methyltetrahydrofolate--homocysteine methyltransferase